MHPAFRGRSALAMLAALTLLLSGAPAAAAVSPKPVLTSTYVDPPVDLSALATARRITYGTTTGLVFTPLFGKADRTVAWGSDRECGPAAIAALLAEGWTVVAPDGPVRDGPGAARAMIDGVRAARRLDSALSAQYAVYGHGAGGRAALFAGELAPAYDGALQLRGVAAVAPRLSPGELMLTPSGPSTSILLIHGTADTVAPHDTTAGGLVTRLNTYGQSIFFVPVEGAGHDAALTETTGLVTGWLADRFA